ncbi:hypothetical protein ACOJBO_25895 [Rhizobium beringeri]
MAACLQEYTGRHLHDGREAVLAGQGFDWTGTPKTGSGVIAAVMPGRGGQRRRRRR